MKALAFAWVIFLAGCAANSGVIPMGPNTYLVSRQAATGFSGAGTLKAEALQEAGAYCSQQKLNLMVVSTSEAGPPYILGNFPKAEVQFMCLREGDSELTRPKLQQAPNVVIENRRQ